MAIKKSRIIAFIATSVVAFCISNTTWSETATNATLKRDSNIYKYVMNPRAFRSLVRNAAKQDKRIGFTCKSKHTIKVLNAGLYGTVDMPEGAKFPVAGAWAYKFEVTRCDKSRIFNTLVVARKDGRPPRMISLIPGKTMTSPTLQRDAKVVVIGNLAMHSKKSDCKDFLVLNSNVVRARGPMTIKGKTLEGVWVEDWNVHYCASISIARVFFLPDGKGGTNISVKINPKKK